MNAASCNAVLIVNSAESTHAVDGLIVLGNAWLLTATTTTLRIKFLAAVAAPPEPDVLTTCTMRF